MFSMFMKLFKQDPQLLGPGHVVLHSWPRISKSFISRPHQVPHIGGGASAPEGRVEKPLPMQFRGDSSAAIQPIQTSKHDILSLRR